MIQHGRRLFPVFALSALLALPLAALAAIPPRPNQTDVVVLPRDQHQVSPSVAFHPTNPDIVLLGGRTHHPDTDLHYAPFHASAYWSLNAGATWAARDSLGGEGPGSVEIGPDGRFMVVLSDRQKVAVNYMDFQSFRTSSNSGVTWAEDWFVDPFRDCRGYETRVVADRSPGSPFLGNYYDVQTDGNGAHIWLRRSLSGGVSWLQPDIDVSNGASGVFHHGGNVAVGPEGEVYVCWAIYDVFGVDEAAIGLNRSTDGGATWLGATRKIDGIRGHGTTSIPNTPVYTPSFPSIAVDRSNGPHRGTVYIAWTNVGVPGVNTGVDTDIWLSRSTDGGATFSTPSRVNDDASGRSQWAPQIACDPVTGVVGMVFYDRRDDPGNVWAQVYMALSDDAGATWTNFPIADHGFTPTAPESWRLGLALQSNRAVAAWTDSRSGLQRLFTTTYQLDQPPGPSDPGFPIHPAVQRTDSSAIVTWRNPVRRSDGTWLGNFAGLRIYRDDVLVATVNRAASDTGSTDQFVDTPPLGNHYTYHLSAIDADVPPRESPRILAGRDYIGPFPRVLLWDPPGVTPGSADSIAAALGAWGIGFTRVSDLFVYSSDLRVHQTVFGVAGAGSTARPVTVAESAALDSFVQAGRGLYLEGGDCLRTSSNSTLRRVFSLQGGSRGPTPNATGEGPLAGFSFTHAQPTIATDRLWPNFSTQTMSYDYEAVAVFNATNGVRAIGTTIRFGALVEPPGATTYSKLSLMRKYLDFMGVSVPVGVHDRTDPRAVELGAVAPNPFRQRMEIGFDLPVPGTVRLEIFDLAGRRVRTLVEGTRSAGRHSAGWDGRSPAGVRLAPGLYLVSIEAGGVRQQRRVVMLTP